MIFDIHRINNYCKIYYIGNIGTNTYLYNCMKSICEII